MLSTVKEKNTRLVCPSKDRIHLCEGWIAKIEVFEDVEEDIDDDDGNDNNNNNAANKKAQMNIRITYTRGRSTLIDRIVIEHEHRSFLLDVVHALHACFSK